MKNILLTLMVFGIVSCSNKEPVFLQCFVQDSIYEFAIDFKNNSVNAIKKHPGYAGDFSEYDLEIKKNFYHLLSPYDGSIEYKITRTNPTLITEQQTTFICKARLADTLYKI